VTSENARNAFCCTDNARICGRKCTIRMAKVPATMRSRCKRAYNQLRNNHRILSKSMAFFLLVAGSLPLGHAPATFMFQGRPMNRMVTASDDRHRMNAVRAVLSQRRTCSDAKVGSLPGIADLGNKLSDVGVESSLLGRAVRFYVARLIKLHTGNEFSVPACAVCRERDQNELERCSRLLENVGPGAGIRCTPFGERSRQPWQVSSRKSDVQARAARQVAQQKYR